MKINSNIDRDTFSMDVNPEDGNYLLEIQEGIKLLTKDNGNKTILIQTKIEDVHGEGDHESIGLQAPIFALVEKDGKEMKMGGRTIEAVLVCTGQVERIIERFGDSVEMATEDFVEELNLRLPGTTLVGQLKTNGKGYQNFTKFEKFSQGF